MKTLTALAALFSLLTAGATFAQTPAPTPAGTGDEEAGREAFVMECRACHNGAIGPALRGVAGRKIASVEAFTGYSDALKAKGADTWTDANLDTYLKSPAEFAPGTRMMKTTPEAQTRADIIAYLKSLPPPK